ncbi:hypothetical protein UA19_01918 [Burkholderia multivorans]|nr:hypothetical protein UA19_01918 [Burkholderia multivorans]SAK18783.1 hypothetical protein UA21_01978 [Burkholderia multivorans]
MCQLPLKGVGGMGRRVPRWKDAHTRAHGGRMGASGRRKSAQMSKTKLGRGSYNVVH